MSVELGRLDQAHDHRRPLPLRRGSANNQFDRPSAHDRIKFSIWLLSMGLYSKALAVSKRFESQ